MRLFPVSTSLVLLALVSGLGACGTTSQTSQTFTQSQCIKTFDIVKNPGDAGEEKGSLTATKQGVSFEIKAANFRCEQEVIVEHKLQGQTLTITARPKDMNPATVARCGNCTYDISGSVTGLTGGITYQVELIRQHDNYGGTGEIKSLLKITVTPTP